MFSNITDKKVVHVIALMALVLCCLVLAGCGGGSAIYGKYTVAGVLIDGEIIDDYEEIADTYGYSIYGWKEATLTLTKSGNAVLSRPDGDGMMDVQGKFTYQDHCIELISANDEDNIAILDYKDGKIFFDGVNGDMTLVFSK